MLVQLNTERVWSVNGVTFKADGNFLGEFNAVKIGDAPITLGPYPASVADFQKLRAAGIAAVINLMNHNDHRQLGLTPEGLQRMAREAGIAVYSH